MKFTVQAFIVWSCWPLNLANTITWTKTPGDVCGVTGHDVLLLWEYEPVGDVNVTTWYHGDPSNNRSILAAFDHRNKQFAVFADYKTRVVHYSCTPHGLGKLETGGIILKNLSLSDIGNYSIGIQPSQQNNYNAHLTVYEENDLNISITGMPTRPVNVTENVTITVTVRVPSPTPNPNVTVIQRAVSEMERTDEVLRQQCPQATICMVELNTQTEGRFNITADVQHDCYDYGGRQIVQILTVGTPCGVLCDNDHCQNGGTCRITDDCSPTCTCAGNFVGDRCENRTPCSGRCGNDHCQNGGTCNISNECSLICTCAGNFVGDKCEDIISEGNNMALIIGVAVAGAVVVVIVIIVVVVLHRKGRLTKKSKSSGAHGRTLANGGGRTQNDSNDWLNNAPVRAPQNVDPEGTTDQNPPESNDDEPPEDVPAVPKKNFGPDVILYADLDFNRDATAAPPVVHRKVEPTEYADINFARSAKAGKK